jgi:hypothetical protein
LILIDTELQITLPNAFLVVHVDDDKADWRQGWSGSNVDWAWQEQDSFFLCEIKDPECTGAVNHPKTPSHVAQVVGKLASDAFPNEFAKNVKDTLDNQPHCKTAKNVRYVVVAGISDPNFVSAVAGPASAVIQRHLLRMDLDIPVLVVNIAMWNELLAPRAIARV